MHRYHYLYRIDNIVNGKFYYGIRSCYCDPESDPYMGSGTLLNEAYREEGIQNFKKTIVELVTSRGRTI